MADRQINDPQLVAAFVEIAAIKLVLAAFLRGGLPEDRAAAQLEIDAMEEFIKRLAFRSHVGPMDRQDAHKLMEVAQDQAIRFLREVVLPKPKGN